MGEWYSAVTRRGGTWDDLVALIGGEGELTGRLTAWLLVGARRAVLAARRAVDV